MQSLIPLVLMAAILATAACRSTDDEDNLANENVSQNENATSGDNISQPDLPAEVLASPFGINGFWEEMPPGATWIRCGSEATPLGNWTEIQPERGVYDFESAESELFWQYEIHDVVPASNLSNTPSWASPAPDSEHPGWYPPIDVWDYFHYAREISRYFDGRVWFWEIWNEPNLDYFHGSISEYAELLKAGAAGIRAGSSQAYVLSGGTSGVDLAFIDRCYQYGAGNYFDVLAVHPYQWESNFDDDYFGQTLEDLRILMQHWDDDSKPIWLNEWGWRSTDPAIGEEGQARLLVQSFVTTLCRSDLGLQRSFWTGMKDWPEQMEEGELEHGWGLLDNEARAKPAWYAYRIMVERLEGRKCLGYWDVDSEVRAYMFSANDQQNAVVVVWSADDQTHEISLPINISPEQGWAISGDSITLPEASGGALPIRATPAPVYLLLDQQALSDLIPVVPLDVQLPDSERRVAAWLSVYPQEGCSLPWLQRDTTTELSVQLFNGMESSLATEVTAILTDPEQGIVLAETSADLIVESEDDERFTLSIDCPETAPDEALLTIVAESEELRLTGAAVTALCGNGPTLNFLPNSHLERDIYLHDSGTSLTAASVRFGDDWTYALPVPFDSSAEIQLKIGAASAGLWKVTWSNDGVAYQPLLSGESTSQWHEAQIDELSEGTLYLHFEGYSVELYESRATFIGAR